MEFPLYGELHISYCHHLFLEQADELTNPEHKRCAANDDYQVDEFERFNVEELAAYADNQYLTEQNHKSYQSETTTTLEVECRASGLKGTGVEHVPELEEHKDCEEERQLISAESGVGTHCNLADLCEAGDVSVLEVVEKSEKEEEKHTTHTNDRFPHRVVDDEGLTRAGFLFHYSL